MTAREKMYDEAHDFLVAFYAGLPNYVGNTAAGLAPYGKAPPKERTPATAAQNAITTEKRNATRVARGTTSKKQKSKIHGTLPATTTPAPAAVAPAPAAATAAKTGG